MNNIFAMQSDHPLFRYFTPEEREKIESLAKVYRVSPGQLLIEANETDSTLFAVEDGLLEVVVDRGGQISKVATVGPGDVLGEVSFIDDSPRSVSVKAAEETTVRAWNKKRLNEALAADKNLLSKFAVAMTELLVERLRDSVRRQGSFRPI